MTNDNLLRYLVYCAAFLFLCIGILAIYLEPMSTDADYYRFDPGQLNAQNFYVTQIEDSNQIFINVTRPEHTQLLILRRPDVQVDIWDKNYSIDIIYSNGTNITI